MYILLRICLLGITNTCVDVVHYYDFVEQLSSLGLMFGSRQCFRKEYIFSLFFWGEVFFFDPHWTYQLPKKVGQKII